MLTLTLVQLYGDALASICALKVLFIIIIIICPVLKDAERHWDVNLILCYHYLGSTKPACPSFIAIVHKGNTEKILFLDLKMFFVCFCVLFLNVKCFFMRHV